VALNVYFEEDIFNVLLAGLVLELRTAAANGGHDVAGVQGALRAYEHTANAFGLVWIGSRVIDGAIEIGLLDQAYKSIAADGINAVTLLARGGGER